MIDDVTQQNLLFCNEALAVIKKEAERVWKRAYGFSGVYNSLSKLRPYIDNLALFCNEYLCADISSDNSEDKDLISRAEGSIRLIGDINQVISSRLSPKDNKSSDIYTEEYFAVLSKRLQDINRQPPEQALLNRYFMKGALEVWDAVASHRRQECTEGLSEKIDKTEIEENIVRQFSQQSIFLSDDDEKMLSNTLFTCCDKLLRDNVLTPDAVGKTITQSVGENLGLEEQTVQAAIGSQQETLFNILKKEKAKIRRNQSARRELRLFANGIAPILHKDAENMIYLSQFKKNVPVEDYSLDSGRELPPHLKPFCQDARFKNITKQMKFWEDYESKAAEFDRDTAHKNAVYEQLDKVNMYRLGLLYSDLNIYEDDLDDWLDSDIENDDDNDDSDSADREYPDSAQRQNLLDYAMDLEEAIRHGKKYSGLDLNDTGIEEATLQKLQKQDVWRLQDANLLETFFGEVAYQLDENISRVAVVENIDFEKVMSLVQKMPHGRERYDALCCLEGTFDARNAALDEEMFSLLDEIDNQVGHLYPAANQVVVGLLEDAAGIYPDLKNEDMESLFNQIRLGVLSASVIPVYQGIEIEDDLRRETVSNFVENYKDYTPETQSFILGLSKYYTDKIVPFHQKALERGEYSGQLKKSLDEYENVFLDQCYMDSLTDKVNEEKQEEYQLLSDYQNYKKQKALFELPDNFDVMLAAKFYGDKKSR